MMRFSLFGVVAVAALSGCVNRQAPAPEPMYYQHNTPAVSSGVPNLPPVPQPQVHVVQPGQPMPTHLSVGTTAETLPDGTTVLTTPSAPAPASQPMGMNGQPYMPSAAATGMMAMPAYQSKPAHPNFTDIPMPVAFDVDQNNTIVFTSTTQSVGKIVLNGKSDQKSIYDFYVQQMPLQGWKMVNAFQSKNSSLYFAKPGTFAAVLVEPVGRSKTQVTVNIGPE